MQRLTLALLICITAAAHAQGIKRSEGPERGGARDEAPTKLARQIPLWPNGAPGFESKRHEPEEAKDYWVKNIHNPSITVDKEVKQDAYRAMRLVRSNAAEWHIDPDRVGTLSFSAGGEVANIIAYSPGKGDPQAPDSIDRLDGKPNFQILVYPGRLGVPEVVPADAPPAFLIAANDDPCCSTPVVTILERYRAAHVSVEAHILSGGKHGFNMGYHSNLAAVKAFPQMMANWLTDMGLTKRKP